MNPPTQTPTAHAPEAPATLLPRATARLGRGDVAYVDHGDRRPAGRPLRPWRPRQRRPLAQRHLGRGRRPALHRARPARPRGDTVGWRGRGGRPVPRGPRRAGQRAVRAARSRAGRPRRQRHRRCRGPGLRGALPAPDPHADADQLRRARQLPARALQAVRRAGRGGRARADGGRHGRRPGGRPFRGRVRAGLRAPRDPPRRAPRQLSRSVRRRPGQGPRAFPHARRRRQS